MSAVSQNLSSYYFFDAQFCKRLLLKENTQIIS